MEARKTQFIEYLSAGSPVDDVFVVSGKTVAQKRSGDVYLQFVFSDRTGEIKGVAWDDVDAISREIAPGDFARVSGTVLEYRGSLQLTVKSLERRSVETVDPGDFLPVTRRDPEKMAERLKAALDEGLTHPHLKALLEAFWADAEFLRRFKTAPAAKKMHHAYLGGLLEHTLSMTILVNEIAKHYSGVDTEILLLGAFLHDIGKTREFRYDYTIDYSDEGKLITHIVIGCLMLEEKIREIPEFPKELETLLKHMIVSHHGSREFGSPEPPRTLEAVLLNFIDEIDAKMNGLREFIAKEGPDARWSSFNPMLARHLYIRKRDPGPGV